MDKPTLRVLLEELRSVTDWFTLGTLLGVEHSKLTQIQAEYANFPHVLNRCKIELFSYWLDMCHNPTWDMVANALDGIGAEAVARNVRKNHCKKSCSQGELHQCRCH